MRIKEEFANMAFGGPKKFARISKERKLRPENKGKFP
jgi:hypothetical protein